MRRRATTPKRKRVFLGCEGRSEHGYATLLAQLARDNRLHVHIHVQLLQPGAGDPLQLVQKALRLIADLERRGGPFAHKAVLLDIGDEDKMARAQGTAQGGIGYLIWQAPDHEAVLLRHLPGCDTMRPPAGASLAALRRHWPEYEKGQSAQQLAERIRLPEVRQASFVEAELRRFLEAIGFAP